MDGPRDGEFALREFEVSSHLRAAPETVWRHAASPAGVNREFRPLLRMTFPTDVTDLFASWHPGKRLFRSWLLLGGILPVEYDDVAFVAVEPGHRFLERSALFSQRVWEHERIIEREREGCRLTDRVRFSPRVRWLASVYTHAFRAIFELRHRNLRRLFATDAA